MSERTLQRWLADPVCRRALACQYVDGKLLFCDADIPYLRQWKTAKSEAARAGISAAQGERIAQLTAGVTGGRREAEAIRRELRALADTGHLTSVTRRITALLEHVPALRRARAMQRLVWYYAAYHATTDLVQLEGTGAPAVATVDRAFRAALRRP